MKHIKLFSFLMVYIAIASKLIAQLPSSDPAYELVFVDEFNGSLVDTSVWLQRPPWGQASSKFERNGVLNDLAYIKGYGGGNHYLDTENSVVSNGSLKLISKKEDYITTTWQWPPCNEATNKTIATNMNCLEPCQNHNNAPIKTCWIIEPDTFKFTTSMLYSRFPG